MTPSWGDLPAGAWLMAAAVALAALASIPTNWVTARTSGWRALACAYPGAPARDGAPVWALCTLSGPGGFNRWVRLQAGATHLHAASHLLHQPSRRPFSVPWPEVEAWVERRWYGPRTCLRFAQVPTVRLCVKASVGRRLVEGSRGLLVVR
jgi:hypothetical protein